MSLTSLMAAVLSAQPLPALTGEELGRKYWLAVDAGRRASNMTCALKDFPRYDDESSPFKRNNARLIAIAEAIEKRDEQAILLGRRGLVIAPPTMWCDDPEAARNALDTYEQRVDELEALLAVQP